MNIFKKTVKRISAMIRDISRTRYYSEIHAAEYIRRKLLAEERYQQDSRLVKYGYRFYSQYDEDGIIHEIFRRIGTTSKRFVEFGIGDGLENNTAALLFDGWSGLWIEGSSSTVRRLGSSLPELIKSNRLTVRNAFVSAENINQLIQDSGIGEDVDLLSVDIDGNDMHVTEAITCINPRVIVIEYNAKFPPHLAFTIKYDPRHIWNNTDYMGASLGYITERMTIKGYSLVGCSMSGANAFFVRDDVVGDEFCSPFTANNHYEPERYVLARLGATGHKSEYRTLDRAVMSDIGL